MPKLKKGQKAPRETVVCTRCGTQFSRPKVGRKSDLCKECKAIEKENAKKFRGIGCPYCREKICDDAAMKGGVYACPRCEENYQILGKGWWSIYMNGEKRVFYKDQYLGNWEKSGDYARLMKENPDYPRP